MEILYSDQYEEIYKKMNFVRNINWNDFVNNQHMDDINLYIECLKKPQNPWNCGFFPKEKLTECMLEKFKEKYKYFTFSNIFCKYLTQISRSFIDSKFSDFFMLFSKCENVSAPYDNKLNMISLSHENNKISITVNVANTNFNHFLVQLPNSTDEMDLNLFMYVGNNIEISNVVLNNGLIFRKLNNDICYYDEKTDILNEYKTYIIEFPSILDLCILTYYHKYQLVCRWNG